jgi:ribonuclease HI
MDKEVYKKQRTSMRKWNVRYIEQLLEKEQMQILPWTKINPSQGSKRKQPEWYKILKDRWNEYYIAAEKELGERQWKYIANPRRNDRYDLKRIKWIAFEGEGEMIIGRKKRKTGEDKAKFIHYVEEGIDKSLIACEGCKRSDQVNKKECQFEKRIVNTWSPVVKKVKITNEDTGEKKSVWMRTQRQKEENGETSQRAPKRAGNKRKRNEEQKESKLYTDAAWDRKTKKGSGSWLIKINEEVVDQGRWDNVTQSATQIEIETLVEGLKRTERVGKVEIITDAETISKYIEANHRERKAMRRTNKEGAPLHRLEKVVQEQKMKIVKVRKVKEDKADETFKYVDRQSKEQLRNTSVQEENGMTKVDRGIVWEEGTQN